MVVASKLDIIKSYRKVIWLIDNVTNCCDGYSCGSVPKTCVNGTRTHFGIWRKWTDAPDLESGVENDTWEFESLYPDDVQNRWETMKVNVISLWSTTYMNNWLIERFYLSRQWDTTLQILGRRLVVKDIWFTPRKSWVRLPPTQRIRYRTFKLRVFTVKMKL